MYRQEEMAILINLSRRLRIEGGVRVMVSIAQILSVFGAIIGIIGNVYHINCVNGYVVKHRDAFERIESEFSSIRTSNQTENIESTPALA